MGSGSFASGGFEIAAYQNTIFSMPEDENGGVGAWGDLSPLVQSLSFCSSLDTVEAANGGSWGTYLFFGGPGGSICN